MTVIGWGGTALFLCLGIFWHSFFRLALVFFVGWLAIMFLVLFLIAVLGVANLTLSVFGYEIRRKRR